MKKYTQKSSGELKTVYYEKDSILNMKIEDVEEVTEIFQTPLQCSYNWDYSVPDTRIKRLYKLGKRLNWDVEVDLDWNESLPDGVLAMSEEANPYAGFSEYEKMSFAEKLEFSWIRMGSQASIALHGEQGALLVASQLASCAPSFEAKMYAASQTFDEARHVEFFNKFIKEKAKVLFPCRPSLKSLLDKILSDERWDLKFIGMQIIFEGLALATFNTHIKYCNVPVFKKGLHYILRDEARHVSFGVCYLEEYLKRLNQEELDERAVFAFYAATGMFGNHGRGEAVYEKFGWDSAEVETHLKSSLSLESTQGKNFLKQLFGRILPNLKKIGLMTNKSEPLWDEFGVLEFKDLPPDAEISWDKMEKPLEYEEETCIVIS